MANIGQSFYDIKSLKDVKWFTPAEKNKCRFFEPFSLRHSLLGDLNIEIRNMNNGSNRDIIEIKNAQDKVLGSEVLSVNPQELPMLGYNIVVHPEYRKKGFRLGELLRTFSILTMLENKNPALQIYSKDTAVYFHSKYKFKPDNISFITRDRTLDLIASEEQLEFETLAQEAKNIQKRVNENVDDSGIGRKLCVETNDLTERYINKALEEEQPERRHSFFYGFDMVLSRENILKYKEFYNNLFKKFGINYTIE